MGLQLLISYICAHPATCSRRPILMVSGRKIQYANVPTSSILLYTVLDISLHNNNKVDNNVEEYQNKREVQEELCITAVNSMRLNSDMRINPTHPRSMYGTFARFAGKPGILKV